MILEYKERHYMDSGVTINAVDKCSPRVEIIHPDYGKLPYVKKINIDTMQGEEYHKGNLKHVDLSKCTIIIKPL